MRTGFRRDTLIQIKAYSPSHATIVGSEPGKETAQSLLGQGNYC
jgi:hypothetical protein